jgi:peptidyl-tRNA hydrolase
MNSSGASIKCALSKTEEALKEKPSLLILHDDLNQEPGQFRIRTDQNPKQVYVRRLLIDRGHRGVESVMRSLGRDEVTYSTNLQLTFTRGFIECR